MTLLADDTSSKVSTAHFQIENEGTVFYFCLFRAQVERIGLPLAIYLACNTMVGLIRIVGVITRLLLFASPTFP